MPIGRKGRGKWATVREVGLAYRRDGDLKRLGEDTDPRRQFDRFRKVVSGRDGEGALRDNTEICLELMREGVAHRLRWRQDGQGVVVEEKGNDGRWAPSASQAINAERFPIRLFSQGQIAAMAGDSRQALLDVIDEAANIGEKHRAFQEAKRTYFAQRARLRDLVGRLEERPELERKLADLVHKLEAFTQSHHAEVLKSHQRALRQRREIDGTLNQMQAMPGRIEALAQEILLDDWPDGIFDTAQDADILEWRSGAERALAEARETLTRAARVLTDKTRALGEDDRLAHWRQRADQAQAAYDALQATLAEQGVSDPQAFGRLVQQRQQLEVRIKELNQLQKDRKRLQADSETQWQRVLDARKAINQARTDFVTSTLETNEFVRMQVLLFGFDAFAIERSLRDLLDVQNDRFENDILRLDGGEPVGGLAFELAQAEDREDMLEQIKHRLIDVDSSFGGHFRNYLQRKLEKPEFADRKSTRLNSSHTDISRMPSSA